MEKMLEKRGQEAKTSRMREVMKPLAEGLTIVALAAALSGCKTNQEPRPAPLGQPNESQVILAPAEEDGKVINMALLEYEPGATKAVSSLRNAHFTVEYFNGDGRGASWLGVPECLDVVADQVGPAQRPVGNGATMPVPYYYGQCDLSVVTAGPLRTDFRVTFVPQPNDNVAPSTAIYEFTGAGPLERARRTVFESDHVGRTAGGQVFGVGVTHIRKNGGPFVVGVVLNVVDSTPTDWMVYQREGASMRLLNPRYSEGSNARYIGAVMRGVQLTDGSRGDFVVKVYGNMSRPAGLPAGTGEWSPITESDGRIRPDNVIMRLETGKLYPDASRPLDPVFR